jgi:ribosomal protein L29
MTKQVEAVHLLRSMTADDLELHLQEQRRRLFEVRFQQAAGQVENHRQVRDLRREIARTMTLQLELVRGHHLASDLVEVEEPEEQTRPRRLGRRRAEPVAEVAPVDAEVEVEEPEEQPRPRRLGRRRAAPAVEVEPVGAEGAEPVAAEPEVAEPEVDAAVPEAKPRRARRREVAPPIAETELDAEPAPGAEAAEEDATGPDEEETDE